jgi:hypothetical protein
MLSSINASGRCPVTTKEHSYGFVSTSAVLDQLLSNGFVVRAARQKRVLNPEREGYQTHFIELTHPELIARGLAVDARGGEFRVILKNAHDGTSAFWLNLGFFRSVCQNGLVIGSSIGGIKVMHSKRLIKDVESSVTELIARAPLVAERVHTMQAMPMHIDAQVSFAFDAARLRQPELNSWHQTRATMIDRLLQARRREDAGSDLWSVFNRVQENLVKPFNLKLAVHDSQLDRDEDTSRIINMRKIHSASGLFDFNKRLYQLAELYANIA